MIKKIRKTDFLDEDRMISVVNFLLLIASVCIYHGLLYYVTVSVYEPKPYKEAIPNKEIILIETPRTIRIPKKSDELMGHTEILNAILSLPISYTTMHFEYCGKHYITAYCPEKCGYRVYPDGSDNYPAGWMTASDTICHYSEDNSEATTCAIDRRYHDYGEYLWVDGKLYITEDTGPGVQGLWVDVFMPDYDSMASFGSHYSIVYSVTFETHYSERRLINELINHYLPSTMPDCRIYAGDVRSDNG